MIRRYITLGALLMAPFIQPGGTDSLEVTPSSGTVDAPPYAQAYPVNFSVKNTGSRTVDVAISAPGCQPHEQSCAWSTFSLDDIAPNESRSLTITVTTGAPGSSGTVGFIALVNDNQTVQAGTTVTVRVPQQAWLETKALNPGTTIERSHCVAFAVATNAAYECGDLRIAHALPSLRVRGDDRTPVLLYNTAHAEPRPVALANVSAPAGGATNVTAKLSIRRGASDVQVVDPTPFANIPGDSTRRIALTYDASDDTTGVYPYTFTVTMAVGGVLDTLTASDTLVVVNRKASAFGAGWWLAGYERLVRVPGGGFLWSAATGAPVATRGTPRGRARRTAPPRSCGRTRSCLKTGSMCGSSGIARGWSSKRQPGDTSRRRTRSVSRPRSTMTRRAGDSGRSSTRARHSPSISSSTAVARRRSSTR